jgi:hypothetical protein
VTRLVFEERQAPQPECGNEEELAHHDLEYLLAYLSRSRSERYELVERPDRVRRTGVAPDYLVREIRSGRLIAVERAQLMKEDLQAAKARLIRDGANAIVVGPADISPQKIAEHLVRVIERKISRGQLLAVSADERILLLRNRLLATARTFLDAEVRFDKAARHGVDHTYVIASSLLVQIW